VDNELIMDITLRLPDELAPILGPDPNRAALEAILAQLAHERKISVGYAGQLLGFDRFSAIDWYTSHGYPYPDLTAEELAQDARFDLDE
jgi:Uncharacterised protein family (UPF0175)